MATSTDDGDIGLNQEATDDEVKLLTDEAPPGDAPAATPPSRRPTTRAPSGRPGRCKGTGPRQ